MAYRNSFIKINKCPACGFVLTKRSNNMCMSVNKIEKALKFKMPRIDDEIENLCQRLNKANVI